MDLADHGPPCYNICMIVIDKTPALPNISFPQELQNEKRLVFFDIETTGLSSFQSSLYLIGVLVFEDGNVRLIQWFSPSLSSEIEILRAFFEFLRADDVLVSFNGETFDINYLNACADQYRIPSPLLQMKSVDILRIVRKHKKLLGLENLRQKTIEQFLCIQREDRYSGGELIPVYETYSENRNPRLLQLLLLHNEEDLLGMPALLPVLSYAEAVSHPGTPEEIYRNKSGSLLTLSYSFSYNFPRPLQFHDPRGIRCTFSDLYMTLEIPVIYDELKYYFPNYKDYYYLPVEDRAIHKKLGKFVDKAFRTQAAPDTCYTKHMGFFIPALKNSGFPNFKKSYDDLTMYHALENEEMLGKYAEVFFSFL